MKRSPLSPVAQALRERLTEAGRPLLGRALEPFHCDAGDCGGCAVMLAAARRAAPALLALQRSPVAADILIVTGPLTRNLAESVERALEMMSPPALVVALGDCAIDGGVFRESYAVRGGVGATLPVDLTIRGCPPAPEAIVAGLEAVRDANDPRLVAPGGAAPQGRKG